MLPLRICVASNLEDAERELGAPKETSHNQKSALKPPGTAELLLSICSLPIETKPEHNFGDSRNTPQRKFNAERGFLPGTAERLLGNSPLSR